MALELYGPVFDDAERTFVVWPFFATALAGGESGYHPEFLDGFEYHVASSEISRRFESEPARHPVESATTGGSRSTPNRLESDVKTTSGPRIVIRQLSGLSTREQRDSVSPRAMPKPSELDRIELWCVDCSSSSRASAIMPGARSGPAADSGSG